LDFESKFSHLRGIIAVFYLILSFFWITSCGYSFVFPFKSSGLGVFGQALVTELKDIDFVRLGIIARDQSRGQWSPFPSGN
jgi:hypothetical protein